jgi:hypothetical protein
MDEDQYADLANKLDTMITRFNEVKTINQQLLEHIGHMHLYILLMFIIASIVGGLYVGRVIGGRS